MMSTRTISIIYWISTLWLSLGMVSTAVVQVLGLQTKNDFMSHLGYPTYTLQLIGIWKILGTIAILLPRFALYKEWAYAGFFFCMTGAAYSHIATSSTHQIYPSLLLLVLTIISWWTRPAEKRLQAVQHTNT